MITTAMLSTLISDCIKVARENVCESHVQEFARIFAAVLTETGYADVPKETVETFLTTDDGAFIDIFKRLMK